MQINLQKMKSIKTSKRKNKIKRDDFKRMRRVQIRAKRAMQEKSYA